MAMVSMVVPAIAARMLRLGIGDASPSGPRPPSSSTVHGFGPDPLRLLLFGGGPALGYGVTSHEVSLGGHLARQLARAIGRGIDMDIVTEAHVTAASARKLAEALNPSRYDAIIVAIGVQDALDLARPEPWTEELAGLQSALRSPLGKSPRLFFVGVPAPSRVMKLDRVRATLFDAIAERLDASLKRMCIEGQSTFLLFSPTAKINCGEVRHRGAETYRSWAELLAPGIAEVMAKVPARAAEPASECERLAALRGSGILEFPADEWIQRIVEVARGSFGVAAAAVTLVDEDRVHSLASAGVLPGEIARDVAFCSHAVQASGAFVVSDATRDSRFAANPLVMREHGVRFYAGYAIESPTGERIGVLCIFDSSPRVFSVQDQARLRELATSAQRHLWGRDSQLAA
jgi:GAF domain-containing protein